MHVINYNMNQIQYEKTIQSKFQSISFLPNFLSSLLTFEKCLQSKNPL